MRKFSIGEIYQRLSRFLAAMFCLQLLFLLTMTPAYAKQRFDALNDPAISVKNPANTILIGITKAGSRLVAVGGHGVIVYSDDNGVTWKQAAVPVSTTITCVSFPTPRIGWAAGAEGVVLSTVDGGATWRVVLTGTQVNEMIMTAATQFNSANPTSAAAPTALRRANIFAAAGTNKPFLAIYAPDPQNVVIFGSFRMCVKTTDGGNNWADCSLNIGDPISHNLYGYAKIGTSMFLVGELGTFLRSDDDGANFSETTSPAASTLLGIIATPDNALLTFGVAGQTFRSADLGKSWISTLSTSSDLLSGLVLKNGIVLVISEAGSIYESADNGKTFHLTDLNEGMALFDLTQAGNGDVVFVGSGGVRVVAGASFSS